MRSDFPLNESPPPGGFLWPALVAAAAAALVAMAGARLTELGDWYRALIKPQWQPPDWVFGPVWTLIFALTAAAGVVAWRRTAVPARRRVLLALFALNGALNIGWSALFFRFKRPDLALAEVGMLWLSIVVLIIFTARFARTASILLAPYLLWVTFAAVLNFALVRLNGPFG